MSKRNLRTGCISTALGVVFVMLAINTRTAIDSLFFGLGGAGMANGVVILCRYLYWSRPQRAELYAKRAEEQAIDLRDELKTRLRNESGRYAYLLGMAISAVGTIVFFSLGALGIMDNVRPFVIFLGAYTLFQFAAGMLIYRRLLAKY